MATTTTPSPSRLTVWPSQSSRKSRTRRTENTLRAWTRGATGFPGAVRSGRSVGGRRYVPRGPPLPHPPEPVMAPPSPLQAFVLADRGLDRVVQQIRDEQWELVLPDSF